MEKKPYLILDDEFIQYCKLNEIKDINGFANKIFNEAFMKYKYPVGPNIKKTKNVDVEKPTINKDNIYGE